MLPQLDTIFYPKLSIEANQNHDENKEWVVQPNLELKIFLDPRRTVMAVLEMTFVDFAGNNLPYDISIEAFAGFRLSEPAKSDSSKDTKEAMTAIREAAIGILVGSMREYVAMITSRQPWGIFMLPTVNMADVRTEILTPQAKAPARKKPSKTAASKRK